MSRSLAAALSRNSLRVGLFVTVAVVLLIALRSCEQELQVTATAYNSVSAQTDTKPNLGAWGDEILPGMPVLAVSEDLVELGLERAHEDVRVEGFEEEFVVLDKMHRRWSKKIDIYMGTDVKSRQGLRHTGSAHRLVELNPVPSL